MGRVSLTEAYDDRSVIAKLNEMDRRVKENTTVVTAAEASAKASAAAAQETADRFAGSVGAVVQNANAQINASKAQVDQAKAEVDETVTTVAQAVQTANNASASAQQSANTVAGYDTRLTAAETKNSQQDTAIGALQTADAQNVKLTGNQIITGAKTFKVKKTPIIIQTPDIDGDSVPSNNLYSKIDIKDSAGREIAYFLRRHQANGTANVGMVCNHTRLGKSADISAFVTNDGKTYGIAPTPPIDAPSYAIATKAYVESTDGETNNLMHRTGNENITSGNKFFVNQNGVTMITLKGVNADVNANSYQASIPRLEAVDKNGVSLWQLETTIQADGRVTLNCRIRNSDGSIKSVTLAQGDAIQ